MGGSFIVGEHCQQYTTGTPWGTLIAGVFALGVFASYVPQQLAILERKTTEGLSPYYLMLMNLGSGLSFANVVVLSRPIFSCCGSEISGFYCLSSLMGFLQIGAGFLGPVITLAIAYRFRGGIGSDAKAVAASAKIAVVANCLMWIFAIGVRGHHRQRALATAFGLGAISVGLVQYLPQLWTTYHLKHTGSLSIATMAVQIPGGYLWCLSLARRAGSHWSTWLSLFMAASLQLVLLLMALYYSRYGNRAPVTVADGLGSVDSVNGGDTVGRDSRVENVIVNPRAPEESEASEASETSPLLGRN